MPWVIEGGQMVRITRTVETPEIEVTIEVGVYQCPHCDRVYKTAAGLTKHEADKH